MMSKIPPPIDIRDEFSATGDPSSMKIPFILAEYPRTFLNWLALHSTIDDGLRAQIAEWLLRYNQHVIEHIANTYGSDAVSVADKVAMAIGTKFGQMIRGGETREETDLFNRLDAEIFNKHNNDDGGG